MRGDVLPAELNDLAFRLRDHVVAAGLGLALVPAPFARLQKFAPTRSVKALAGSLEELPKVAWRSALPPTLGALLGLALGQNERSVLLAIVLGIVARRSLVIPAPAEVGATP